MASTERIRDLATPHLAGAGLELWDVEISRGLVRFLVDRPGGVDLETLAEASRVLSPLLDEHPEVAPAGHYQLEVSSPGVERNLRRPEHFQRYIGGEVAVKTSAVIEGSRRHRGVLSAADDEGCALAVGDGSDATTVRFAYDQIERARTVLSWGAPAPTSSSRKGSARAARPARAGRPLSGATDRKDA